jgi:hypothetical protein
LVPGALISMIAGEAGAPKGKSRRGTKRRQS